MAIEINAVTASQKGSGPQMRATTMHDPIAQAIVPRIQRTHSRRIAFSTAHRSYHPSEIRSQRQMKSGLGAQSPSNDGLCSASLMASNIGLASASSPSVVFIRIRVPRGFHSWPHAAQVDV